MIEAKRIPLEVPPIDYVKKVLKEADGSRVCAIIPTQRALRELSNQGFKTVELFSVKEFTTYADNSVGINIPKQLRPFYLRKAVKALSNDDKIAVFRSNNSLFIDNFTAFTQVSSGILSFYRELSAEMVDMQKLSKAGKYTDYELQITVLDRLWHNYISIIKDDGYTDQWENYRSPLFDKDFINRYDEFIFLIGGYLTRYELEQLKQVGTTKKVTLLFNYSGKRHSHHKLYEKYLGITLEDRPDPIFRRDTTKLYACASMVAQLELITRLAFYFHETHNIGFRQMAVIIPDENVKSYFLRLDAYNLFDITSNDNIQSAQFFQILSQVIDISGEIKKSEYNHVEISKIIKLLIQPALNTDKDIISKLYENINDGKIYISVSDLVHIDFFKDYGILLIDTPHNIAPYKVCIAIKKFLTVLDNLLEDQDNQSVSEAVVTLEMLETVYSKIDDIIPFDEATSLIMQELSGLKIRTPKGKIPVTGILECRNLCYDVVFVPAMNEGIFPPMNKKDMFLNTEIRTELELPTFIDRESLLKNYLLQIMERSKFNIITYGKNNDIRRRSRFVEEVAIRSNLQEEEFKPKEITLLTGEKRFFSTNTDIVIEKNKDILEKLDDLRISATAFNDYISCPLRFYLKYVSSVYPLPEPELTISPRYIGTAFHKAMEQVNRRKISPASPDFTEVLKTEYNKFLSRLDVFKYNPIEAFRVTNMENAIEKIGKAEKKRLATGWVAEFTEQSITTSYKQFKLKGFIDRIDKKDDQYEIIDYKYKQVKPITANSNMETLTDLQMPFYAILFEQSMKKLPLNLYYFDLKEQLQFINAFDMAQYDKYKSYITFKLEELVSDNTPFIQTEKTDRCRFCNYAPVCGRS